MDATASLFRAIKDAKESECRRLIEEEGADVHKKDSDVPALVENHHRQFYGYVMGASTIIVAADLGHVDIVKLLLSKGANIHDRSNSGLSALMKASIYGHTKAIDVLLDHGSDIHQKNSMNFNCSSILYACLHSQMQVIQLLMSRGANIYDTTLNGQSCYTMTFQKQIKSVLQWWPLTMAVILLQELLLYNTLYDSLWDLHLYLGYVYPEGNHEEEKLEDLE